MTKESIENKSLDELLNCEEFVCSCGKTHASDNIKVIIKENAITGIPDILKEKSCEKPFILSGKETFKAAGDSVTLVLKKAGIEYSLFVYDESPVEPTEYTLGLAFMHYDFSCDSIIAIGSGVINDTAKFIAKATGNEFILVATAASMDGFLSATSSMDRECLKVSIPTDYAHTIVGDLTVLKNCPMHLLRSGVGDMIAKYVSLVEWRISNIITGEYYCPVIAAMVETARDKAVAASVSLAVREERAIKELTEGLVIAGLAMNYAGISRPASGMEHYFSHIWDMRSLAFEDAGHELHGIQCGIGTLLSIKAWNYICTLKPNREKAVRYVEEFDSEKWFEKLREFVGPGAEQMIAAEHIEKKYDVEKHRQRLEIIIDKWDQIKEIASSLPKYDDVLEMLKKLGAPVSPHEIGYSDEQIKMSFKMTKDIRDKYIGTRLLWDLGELDEAADILYCQEKSYAE